MLKWNRSYTVALAFIVGGAYSMLAGHGMHNIEMTSMWFVMAWAHLYNGCSCSNGCQNCQK